MIFRLSSLPKVGLLTFALLTPPVAHADLLSSLARLSQLNLKGCARVFQKNPPDASLRFQKYAKIYPIPDWGKQLATRLLNEAEDFQNLNRTKSVAKLTPELTEEEGEKNRVIFTLGGMTLSPEYIGPEGTLPPEFGALLRIREARIHRGLPVQNLTQYLYAWIRHMSVMSRPYNSLLMEGHNGQILQRGLNAILEIRNKMSVAAGFEDFQALESAWGEAFPSDHLSPSLIRNLVTEIEKAEIEVQFPKNILRMSPRARAQAMIALIESTVPGENTGPTRSEFDPENWRYEAEDEDGNHQTRYTLSRDRGKISIARLSFSTWPRTPRIAEEFSVYVSDGSRGQGLSYWLYGKFILEFPRIKKVKSEFHDDNLYRARAALAKITIPEPQPWTYASVSPTSRRKIIEALGQTNSIKIKKFYGIGKIIDFTIEDYTIDITTK